MRMEETLNRKRNSLFAKDKAKETVNRISHFNLTETITVSI